MVVVDVVAVQQPLRNEETPLAGLGRAVAQSNRPPTAPGARFFWWSNCSRPCSRVVPGAALSRMSTKSSRQRRHNRAITCFSRGSLSGVWASSLRGNSSPTPRSRLHSTATPRCSSTYCTAKPFRSSIWRPVVAAPAAAVLAAWPVRLGLLWRSVSPPGWQGEVRHYLQLQQRQLQWGMRSVRGLQLSQHPP